MMRVPPGLTIRRLLRPHAKSLAIGIAAVFVEGMATLAAPWPLPIPFRTPDNSASLGVS